MRYGITVASWAVGVTVAEADKIWIDLCRPRCRGKDRAVPTASMVLLMSVMSVVWTAPSAVVHEGFQKVDSS
jgi:hypothetical protein